MRWPRRIQSKKEEKEYHLNFSNGKEFVPSRKDLANFLKAIKGKNVRN